MKAQLLLVGFLGGALAAACATEIHVSPRGNDVQRGTKGAPVRTIQRAAELAQPGDVITVHAGVYRERVNPPRGGSADTRRIIYQAAKGERVEIKGSEVIRHWQKVQGAVWKVTLPDSFFGNFNPYQDVIRGDWFDPKGRPHHTGAVYLNGDWLTEAVSLEEVLRADGAAPGWLHAGGQEYLLNVAWLQPGDGTGPVGRVAAAGFSAQQGIQTAPCSEGGECVGWIEEGDWIRYARLDFGGRADRLTIRAASATEGGVIEVRLDGPGGDLLGTTVVPNTGGWQTWASFPVKLKPVSGSRSVCLVFKRARASAGRVLNPQLWFAQCAGGATTIYAQFKDVDPNRELVEINVRRTVFYPDQPGRNYITVRGFALRHAATPWAPPTAEQVGLMGTHWSRGWVIENNEISHSICAGIALGKHGDEFDNTSANTAEGYVKTIERALARGWNRETIGHHVVRNNTIAYCEQAGVVGSLGCSFSTVTGNTIHDIHVRRLFGGAEMAGIKFHGAIDTTIQGNHIYRTCLGLWLDWMAQGTRVSGNLFHDNAGQDVFVEVDHGPFLMDNNIFLSGVNLLDMSEGGAYVHNLFAGKITNRPEPGRETPYHPAHSTRVAGLVTIKGGDDRFYNNLFIGRGEPNPARRPAGKELEWISAAGLSGYDVREQPLQTGGNVYYNGAQPYEKETNPVVLKDTQPPLRLLQAEGRPVLELTLGPELKRVLTARVTTESLGKAKIPGLGYEHPDGSPLTIDTDYFGKTRSQTHPTPGPFEHPESGPFRLKP